MTCLLAIVALHPVLGLAICIQMSYLMKGKHRFRTLLSTSLLTSVLSIGTCVLVFYCTRLSEASWGAFEGGLFMLPFVVIFFTGVYLGLAFILLKLRQPLAGGVGAA